MRRMTGAVALIAVIAAASTATAAGNAQRGTVWRQGVGDQWGWVVARQTVDHTPATKDQGNSSGGTNTVVRQELGRYLVHLPGLVAGSTFGLGFASALGNQGRQCNVAGTSLGATEGSIVVYCYDALGAAADSRFTASLVELETASGKAAYAFDLAPAATDHTPGTSDQFDSKGGTITIHRSSEGKYQVRMPGLASVRGNVQLSTTGALSALSGLEYNAASCHAVGWGPDGTDLVIDVVCRDSSGIRADSYFAVFFSQGEGLKGPGGTRVAYFSALGKSETSYTPAPGQWYSTAGEPPTIERLGTGHYQATIEGLPLGGAALVTAYGSGLARCSVSSIRTLAPKPLTIGVRCQSPTGTPMDAAFGLSYLR